MIKYSQQKPATDLIPSHVRRMPLKSIKDRIALNEELSGPMISWLMVEQRVQLRKKVMHRT